MLTSHTTFSQLGAATVAGGLTVGVLDVLGSHHAPAGATALLVATGVAGPGRGLYGLLAGLAVLMVVVPTLRHWLPLARKIDRPRVATTEQRQGLAVPRDLASYVAHPLRRRGPRPGRRRDGSGCRHPHLGMSEGKSQQRKTGGEAT